MGVAIAGRIKALRLERGWSKLKLARRFGSRSDRPTIHLHETGQRIPTPETVARYAEIFTASGHGAVTVADIDPDGEAFAALGRRRNKRVKPAQQRADTPSVAPQSPRPEVLMDAGGLLDIPDAELFRKVLGVWLSLDSPAERVEFLKHARSFTPGSAKVKKVRR